MSDDLVLDWLLDPVNPSCRLMTLTTLLGLPADDPQVLQTRQEIMLGGLVPSILNAMNLDGSWGNPDRFYTDKYEGSVWNLLLLAELAADPEDERVLQACEFILTNSQNTACGGFSYTRSAKGGGLFSGVVPCLTGNMVFSLVRLGRLDDPRVQNAIEWIVTWQRADDGDNGAPDNEIYKRYEMCWGKHTCHMGVAKAFKALAAIPSDRRSSAVKSKIEELGEYFLKHHIYRKSHDLSVVSRPGWLKPGFPLMYQTDIAELLDIYASLGWWDERLRDALDVLAGQRLADGRWKMANSFNGKMLVNIEQKGKPSRWITLRALHALQLESCSARSAFT